jgi:putative ABC transport system permease protein
LALPSFGDLIGWRGRSSPGDLGWILSVIVLIVGFVAGGYPALFLSRFQPVETLKGRLDTTRRGRGLRKGLVVFQFGVSGVMIFAAIVVYQQTVFMSEKDLGYDKELLVHLPVERYEHRSSGS